MFKTAKCTWESESKVSKNVFFGMEISLQFLIILAELVYFLKSAGCPKK